MKQFFAKNISGTGRVVRALIALTFLVGAGFGFFTSVWLGLALLAIGIFVAFEAVRGWCFFRACGLKTKY